MPWPFLGRPAIFSLFSHIQTGVSILYFSQWDNKLFLFKIRFHGQKHVDLSPVILISFVIPTHTISFDLAMILL
jgi:hypothetical protein